MAELSEQQDQEVAPDADQPIHRSKSGFWFGIGIVLIILAVAGIGFYLFQQLRTQQETLGGSLDKGDMRLIEMSKQISAYQSQIAAIQTHLAAIEAEIKSKDAQQHKALTDLAQLQTERLGNLEQELSASIQQVQRQLGKTRGDWLIADAEYLLSVANQRLHLMGDVNTAEEALKAADQRLRESGDAGAFKVREQIAKDLALLDGVSVPDIVGLFASVQTLQDQVDKLALIKPYAGKKLTQSEEIHSHAEAPTDSHDLLAKALKQLEGVVTVRHSDQQITEILTPQEAQFIRQQLRVKLEMIKVALVQQNQDLYRSGIADGKAWLEENFIKNDDGKRFLAELKRLDGINMRSQYPDISQSLKILRDITKLRIETDKALSGSGTTPTEQ
ncbi:MAG: enzyme of heme biosynthesis [Gammaproteobacteria bacterium HGW-Gammaproteobacteria-3]|nr:MAG: enzyme of heme biosynthesis [Gammaproteobacteria bacterium HGW-Gammaproteobacteria-3]